MIYIHKANLPEKMADYYKLQIGANLMPKYAGEWGKEAYPQIATQEQSSLCCYCMQEITPKNCSIEHFLPESLYKEEVANYYNLFSVCTYSKGKPKKFHHCDTSDGAKAEKIIPKYISHPKCETFFAYNKGGEILPYCNFKNIESCIENYAKLTDEQRMVLATIEVLKLNVNSLTQQRASFYEIFANKIAAMTNETLLIELQNYYDKKDSLQGEKFCGMYFYLLRMQLVNRGKSEEYEKTINKWVNNNKISRNHTVITHKIEKEQ
jgi:uncharacterized protein (TIGR02646 family)